MHVGIGSGVHGSKVTLDDVDLREALKKPGVSHLVQCFLRENGHSVRASILGSESRITIHSDLAGTRAAFTGAASQLAKREYTWRLIDRFGIFCAVSRPPNGHIR